MPEPVVLVGGLNLVRAAGLAGLHAVVATSDPAEPALASRHCAEAVMLPPAEPRAAWIEALAAVGARLREDHGRRVPLFVGGDDPLEAILAHRDRLAREFLLPIAPPGIAEALIDKDRFQAFAQSRGLPVPPALTWGVNLRRHPGPVVVKPRAKRGWHASALCQRLFRGDGKALVFDTGARAAAEPLVGLHAEELVFQAYVPGGDEDQGSFHGYADASGTILASFTGRKLRTYPVGTGESAFIELTHDPALAALGSECARRAGLTGFFKLDFKRDARDGRWWLLEVNARCTLWNYLGAVNGLNLLRVAHDDLVHGRKPEWTRWSTTYRWWSPALDRRAFAQLRLRGELGAAAWIASLAASRTVQDVFAWSDPGPFIKLAAARLRSRASTRVASMLKPWRSTAS